TCGYLPFGCLMVSDKIASKYDDVVLPLGLTYSAHPVSCAAALETLQVYEDDNLIENAVEMGKYIDKKMEELKAKHPSIGDFRNTGLLGCIELVKNRTTKEPMAPFNAKPEEMTIMNKVEADEGLAMISEAIAIADEYVA